MKAKTTKVKGSHRRVPLAAREVQIIRLLYDTRVLCFMIGKRASSEACLDRLLASRSRSTNAHHHVKVICQR